MTPAELLELRNAGAVRIDLHPDGSLASVHFAPLPPTYAPARVVAHEGEEDDEMPKPGQSAADRRKRLQGRHSGLRPKDLRQAWVDKTGAEGPRKVKGAT